jgi:hypothetical protein
MNDAAIIQKKELICQERSDRAVASLDESQSLQLISKKR